VKITWLGHKQHFIGANECTFSLATEVGKYVVSTIGEYTPAHDGVFEEIGPNRLYETFVFEKKPGRHECGCPKFGLSEIDSQGYVSASKAQKGHEKFVAKYAAVKEKTSK
jgi:hypothetical protein